ncbi:M28 family peptidase [Gallibacterium anatis]|uniref:M28 family peptidase n=1 Tax=Gallibacterium anatis TaxID=750 RepID=UPI00300667B8
MNNLLKPHNTLPQICSYCRAHGSAGERRFINEFLVPTLNSLNVDYDFDAYGNLTVVVSDAPVLFVAHIDTVHDINSNQEKQQLLLGDGILSLNTEKEPIRTCLGADDGAGISVLLYLISKGIGGTYLFTRCEERGGLGADYVLRHNKAFLERFKMAIEIDRKGYNEIITSQGVGDCASNAFAQDIADALGMMHAPSPNGTFTDVATFAEVIPECVNISAGYFNAHTCNEYVDLNYLDTLADALANVDFNALRIERIAGDFGDFGYFNIAQGSGWHQTPFSRMDDELTYEEVVALVQDEPAVAAEILFNLGVTHGDIDDVLGDLYDDYAEAVYASDSRH